MSEVRYCLINLLITKPKFAQQIIPVRVRPDVSILRLNRDKYMAQSAVFFNHNGKTYQASDWSDCH